MIKGTGLFLLAFLSKNASATGTIYCGQSRRWEGGELVATDPLVENCVISHNRAAAYHGGGIYLDENCPATIQNCVVEQNMATYYDPNAAEQFWSRGGGIYVYKCSPVISSCTISNNSSVWAGAGITCKDQSCHASVVNCTVVYNTSEMPELHTTAGIACEFANPQVVNCILWGNDDDIVCCQATYSCIGDGDPGEGNTDDDPHLVGSVYGPHHLGYVHRPGLNPCIGTGTTDPAKLPPAYQFPEFDVDGDPRTVWVGDVLKVDMGSDQRHPFREMVAIRKDYGLDKVIIEWESVSGASYGVYRSVNPFTNYMSWAHIADVPGAEGTTSWEDTSVDFQTEDQRYYKVLDQGGSYPGVWTRPVGFVNASIEDVDDPGAGYESTFFAVPLELKYQLINGMPEHWDESLGSMIAEDLSLGDRIKFLELGHPEESQAYSELTLEGGIWCFEGVPASKRFALGNAFRILRGLGTRDRVTLLGYVPARPVYTMVFRSTLGGPVVEEKERIVEFGYPYPVSTTLNDIRFLRYLAQPRP